MPTAARTSCQSALWWLADTVVHLRAGTSKSRNPLRDPRCVMSLATHPFDLIIEGTASRVSDEQELRSVAAAFNAESWPAEVSGDALTAEYSAPPAGPSPWHVYRLEPTKIFALGAAEPYGATKFTLR